MSWLNKSLSQLQEVSSAVSSFTQEVLAAEPPPNGEAGGDFDDLRNQLDYYRREVEKLRSSNGNNIEARIKIDELSRQSELSESKIDDLQNQVNNLSEELEESINENNKFSKRNSVLSKQNSTLFVKNDELVKDNASLQQSLEQVDAIHQEEIQVILNQRDHFKAQLEPVDNSFTKQIEEENEKLKEEIERLRNDSSRSSPLPSSPSPTPSDGKPDFKIKMAKLQKMLKAKIAVLERKLEDAQGQKSNNEELDQLKIENNDLKRSFDVAKTSSSATIASLESQLFDIQKSNDDDFKNLEVENEDLKQSLIEAEKVSSKLHSQLKEIENEIENKEVAAARFLELDEELTELKKTLETRDYDLQDKTRSVEDLVRQNEEIESQLSLINEQHNGILSKYEAVSAELRILSDKSDVDVLVTSLREELQLAHNIYEEATSELGILKETQSEQSLKHAAAISELTKFASDKDELCDDLLKSQNESEDLKIQLTDASKALENYKQKFASLEAANDNQIMRAKSQLADVETNFEGELDSLRTALKTAEDNYQAEISQLNDDLKNLRIEKNADANVHKQFVTTSHDEIDDLNEKYENFKVTSQNEKDASSAILNSKIDELTSSHETLLHNLVAQSDKDLVELGERLEAAESQIMMYKTLAADQSDQSSDAAQIIANIQADVLSKTSVISSLKDQLRSSQANLEAANSQIHKLEECQSESEKLLSKFMDERAASSNATDEISTLQADISSKTSEIFSLETQLKSSHAELVTTRSHVQDLEKCQCHLEDALTETKEQLSKALLVRDDLSNKLSKLEEMLKTKDSEANDLITLHKRELESLISSHVVTVAERDRIIEDILRQKASVDKKLEVFEEEELHENKQKYEQSEITEEVEKLREQLSSTLEQLEDAEAAAQEAGSILDQLRLAEQSNLKLKDELEKTKSSEKEISQGLGNGNKMLQSALEGKEKEILGLKAQLADSSSGSTTHLQHALTQREHQLQQSLKRNQELEHQVRQMHQVQQDHLSRPDNMLEDQLAHLESEKEYLQQVLQQTKKESSEITNRLQETGQLLQVKSKQLDEFATAIDEAKRISDRHEMTQEAMTKLSHLVRSKDDEIEALTAKNESLMEILRSDDSNIQLTAKLEEIDCLNAKLQTSKSNCLQLSDAYNKLEHSIMIVKSLYEALHQSYEAEKKQVREAMVVHSNQEQAAEETELELAKLRIMVAKIRTHSDAGPISSGVTEGDVDHADRNMLANSVKNLRERCAGLEATNVAMKRDNDALRDQLMNRRDKWDNLQILNKKLADELGTRDHRMSEMQKTIIELKSTLDQKDDLIIAMEKDSAEVNRLRERLVQVDIQHSEELKLIQDSEYRLQSQVDSLRSGLDDVSDARKDLEEKQIEHARGQELKEKCLKTTLEDSRRREKQNEKSIADLQQFIEHFRHQQEMALQDKERRHAVALQRAEKDAGGLRQEVTQLKGRMMAAEARSSESEHLRLQIAESEEKFDRLRFIIDEKAIELDKARQRLTEARALQENTVDKTLAKNILLKYLSLPSSKKNEGNRVLQAVFGLSDEELDDAASAGMGWRGWLRPPRAVPIALDPNKSFSELLVNYLETNSTNDESKSINLPPFPVNAMVGDIGRTVSSNAREKGIEGRNAFSSPAMMSTMMPSSSKHQNALLKGLLDDD